MSAFEQEMFLPGGTHVPTGPIPSGYVDGLALGAFANVFLNFGSMLVAANAKNVALKVGAGAACVAFNGYLLYWYSTQVPAQEGQ